MNIDEVTLSNMIEETRFAFTYGDIHFKFMLINGYAHAFSIKNEETEVGVGRVRGYDYLPSILRSILSNCD